MWIVRLALRRPYTFVVAAMLVAILGVVTIRRMPTDIFPSVDIPVISCVFRYEGISPDEMEKRIVTPFERFLITTVNDVERIESLSLNGNAVIKVYFQPGAKIEAATAQVTAVAQTAIRQMPPGSQPPLIIRYSASDVPILQLSISSDTIPENRLFDITINQLRPQLITVPNIMIPYPYGGKQRQVVVDLDPAKLYAWGISPSDVSAAVNNQNLILPAGSVKVGTQEYPVRLNSSPDNVAALNDLPIKTINGTTVYIRDVAHVRDGFQVQTNIAHADGKRAVLLTILKAGGGSTLDVVAEVKRRLPVIQQTLPADLKITPLFDQSVFVRASVTGVVHEALIAAGLTALMILLFLGSWRSTLIVVISIPLSILVSIIVLSAMGHTLNTMTLGGLALAVGILVDDAIVEIENIHRNLHQRKRLVRAILDGAQQIAVPAFVATLCICIVFVPVVFIAGAAKFLFTPLALAVVFAMMTSYLLSRTLVPTMVHYLLASEVEMYGGQLDPDDPHARAALEAKQHRGEAAWQAAHRPWYATVAFRAVAVGLAALIAAAVFAITGTDLGTYVPGVRGWLSGVWAWGVTHPLVALGWVVGIAAGICLLWLIARFDLIWRTHHAFNRKFETMRRGYGGLLAWALSHRLAVTVAFVLLVGLSAVIYPFIGNDFFPRVDAGQIRLHVRAPAGTRIEETERYFAQVSEEIRKVIPAREVSVILDNMGIPNSGINLSLSDGTLIGPADGEIMIALKEHHAPTADYMNKLRKELPRKFPDCVFFFAASDISTQVLNFGLSAPIDIQVSGPLVNNDANRKLAQRLLDDVRKLPGAADARLAQVTQTPDIRVDVDRTLADQVGVTQRDVAGDLLISLSSSNQVAPNYWLNPVNGVNYNVLIQTPQYEITSLNDLENTPIVPGSGTGTAPGDPSRTQLLGNLATVGRGASATNITHNNIVQTFNVQLDVSEGDLGSVADRVRQVVADYEKQLPKGSKIAIRGQVESMSASFGGLAAGLVFAVLLVYLLMVINFQSWVDPLIILMALPGAAAGILWMLLATGTTVSVPALMGAIMAVGVATANSILVITFANDQRKLGMNAHDAALTAGLTRLRPVCMTALAMIIGMLPMSLGLGEGGEQNAPLGRAVIGGLLVATFATLLFVPVVYSALRKMAPQTHVEPELMEPDEQAAHGAPALA